MDNTLPKESFLALAAIGWADGSLQRVEAGGLLRAEAGPLARLLRLLVRTLRLLRRPPLPPKARYLRRKRRPRPLRRKVARLRPWARNQDLPHTGKIRPQARH